MNSLLALAIIIGSYGAFIEADVTSSPSLPRYGVLCEDTPVRGEPEGAQILYVLSAGEIVPLREQPQFHHRDWVMIKAARWIPLESLCEQNG